MNTLLKPSDNLGGVLRLWAIPAEDVVSLTAGVLSLSGTDNVIALYITPESADSSCLLKKADGGFYYEITVSGFSPRIRKEADQLFKSMAGHNYVVVFLDGNLQYRAAGSKEQPLRFSFSAKTGMAVSDRNGYELEFQRNCTLPVQEISYPF